MLRISELHSHVGQMAADVAGRGLAFFIFSDKYIMRIPILWYYVNRKLAEKVE